MDNARKADGTQVSAETYLEDLKKLEAERANLLAQQAIEAARENQEGGDGKKKNKKRNRQPPLKMYMVYCTEEICRKPVHLINRPSAEGHEYIHEDPTIPPLNLKFAHFGKGHKWAAHPDCDLYNNGERYRNLKDNPHARQIEEKVEAVLSDPENLRKFEMHLKKYFGEQKPGFITDLIKKASREVTHREVLISHPELFLAYAALQAGYHGHKSERSNKIHSTIYRISKWRTVQFTGMDGRTRKVNAPARIKLWYRDGIDGKKPGPYAGWEFQLPFNKTPFVLKTPANTNEPPAGAAPPSASSTTPPASVPPQTAAAPATLFSNIPSDAKTTAKTPDAPAEESPQGDLFPLLAPSIGLPRDSTASPAASPLPESAAKRPAVHPAVIQSKPVVEQQQLPFG